MKTFACLSLLLAVASAAGPNPSYSKGPGPYEGGSYQYFSQRELAQAEDFLDKVEAAKTQLLNKVDMLKNQKSNLLSRLSQFQNNDIADLDNKQDTQDSELRAIERKIKVLLHNISDEVADLEGEAAVAREQEAQIRLLWDRVETLSSVNRRQQATLDKSATFLTEAKEKLNEKLVAKKGAATESINELLYNTKAAGRWSYTRFCQSRSVDVSIDPLTSEGSTSSSNNGVFGSYVPTVYCAMEGFVSKLKIDQSQGYGYGDYADLRQNLAVSVDCKAFNDRVEIKAIDLSKGQGNSVQSVYVQVKECTFGPQSDT